MTTDTRTPDADTASPIDRAPEGLRPYLRLMRADRPVGIWLLFLPCVWGTLGARPEGTGPLEIVWLIFLFGVGAFAMRSAGCVYNDIIDRDLDAQVARTRDRPIASGAVSRRSAAILAAGLCLVGLLVLLQLGRLAIVVGLLSILLVAAYPFMKRITWWPQAWLGLTFNWGVLVGAAAVSGSLEAPALLLYAGGIFWTLGYDTIYAHQDREDDALAGIKSSALALGRNTVPALAFFYIAVILCFALALLARGTPLGLLLLIPAATHLLWQIRRLDTEDGTRCLMLFKSNRDTGFLLALPFLTW